jgi:hypothetical protein
MSRKALWLLPASLAAVVASQWKDIARYVKIHQMSRGAAPPASSPPPTGSPAPASALPADASRGERRAARPAAAQARLSAIPG